jgi:hypothetical protein
MATHDVTSAPERVREQLAQHEEIVHAAIEIHQSAAG